MHRKSLSPPSRRHHGQNKRKKRTPAYNSWAKMMARCYNPKCVEYRWYGAIGRKVCRRWHNFRSFYADMGDRPENTTLDRHPNTAMVYSKETCRWATKKQQSINKGPENFIGRTSKFKGVCSSQSQKRPWRATINVGGAQKSLGNFSTELEAAGVYDEAALALFGSGAYTNLSKAELVKLRKAMHKRLVTIFYNAVVSKRNM